jgi:uncharacterized protein (TIGR03437 family)
LAFDTSSTPILYVADLFNNRILAWKNPSALTLANQADKVIGQRDFYSAFEGGPGRTAPALGSAGLSLPSGLAVDSTGNLYVYDAGNNRILRFPKPLDQQGEFVSPDLVIGQKTPGSGNQFNQGLPKPTEKTLASNRAGSVFHATLAFDPQGNLWASDPGNHRVLRYPKANLSGSEPAADLVLGQSTFISDDAPTVVQSTLLGLVLPSAIAVDSNGGVYVTDNIQRVVYYAAPATGVNATRVLGVVPTPTQQVPAVPAPNTYTVGRTANEVGIPQCVFTLGTIPFVCDSTANRIVRYNSPDQWATPVPDAFSPAQVAFYGQNSALEGGSNRGRGPGRPESNTLFRPSAAAVLNNELWVADTGNNRILVLGETGNLNFTIGTRLVGQARFDANGTNLVEGRDLFVNFVPTSPEIQDRDLCAAITGPFRGSALAVDRNSTPNHLYVADSINNRILAFNDVRSVGTDTRTLLTQEADLFIGQPDKYHTAGNYPNANRLSPSDQGLCTPSGVAVDAEGNLWVADTGNGRLVRFPAPFNQPAGTIHRATVVLGQSNFTFKITDPSSFTMSLPVGVTVFSYGDVAASDVLHNRVLIFHKNGADFVNGQPARAVLGQQNFDAIGASSGTAGLNRPRGLAVDTSDRLFVADSGNNRVLVFTNTQTTGNGAGGTALPNLSSPEGVAISPHSGEIWVAASAANTIYRFLEFSLSSVQPTPTAQLASAAPIALALDNFDNIIAVEAVNRITFYFAQMAYRSTATFASGNNIISSLTPGLYVLVGRLGKEFALTPESAIPPYPTVMSGVQVLVNGIPAPITKTTETLIFFLVPNNAPTSGTADVLVTRPATGEILAAGTFAMGPAAPGLFTVNQQGTGQIAAQLLDGSTNGPSNKVGLGDILILWGTGYGHLDNLPPDGTANGQAIPTDIKPVITIGGITLDPKNIEYSGMNPVLPGLWQINIRLPKLGDPGGAPLPGDRVFILLTMRDKPSNVGGTTTLGVDQTLTLVNGLITTIAIK